MSIDEFSHSFDSMLANLTSLELTQLSARHIDLSAVTASRMTFTDTSSGVKRKKCVFRVDLVTAVGWLDVLDVVVCCQSSNSSVGGGGGDEKPISCVVSLSLASTGFLPLTIPGASLCNIFLCWVPFMSVEQTQRLDFFKHKLSSIHTLTKEEKPCNL